MPLKWKVLLPLLIVTVLVGGGTLVYRLRRLQSVPAAAWHCLREPQQMILYSIHPEEPADFVKGAAVFHGYRILGQVSVAARSEQKRVAAATQHAVLAALGEAACFNPRHGIRVSDGGHTCDFVLCFECGRMDYYLDHQTVGSTIIDRSPDALNAVLREGQVPFAE